MLSCCARLAARWPAPLRRAVGRSSLMGLLAADRARRRTVWFNLSVAFPGCSDEALWGLERAHDRALAEAFFDSALSLAGGPGAAGRLVEVRNAALLQGATRPVIVVGAHSVDVHLALLGLAMLGPGAVVYREPDSTARHDRLRLQVARFGDLQLIPSRNCIRPALRALQSGRALAMLPDQPEDLRGSVAMPFCGGSIAWAPAVCLLARMSAAQVLWFETERSEHGRTRVTLHSVPQAVGVDEQALFGLLSARLQASVRADPGRFRWDRGHLVPGRHGGRQSAANEPQIRGLHSQARASCTGSHTASGAAAEHPPSPDLEPRRLM